VVDSESESIRPILHSAGRGDDVQPPPEAAPQFYEVQVVVIPR
jgi:hypothetical protein